MLNTIKLLPLSIALACALGAFAATARAQEEPAPAEKPAPNAAVRPFKLLQELGLAREQIDRIRAINQTRRPIRQAARARWLEARRALDAAIYADELDEAQIKELTRAAALAQSELLREDAHTELLIRKVLTPEQLVKFRQLRAQLQQRLADRSPPLKNDPDAERRPINRLRQRRTLGRQP